MGTGGAQVTRALALSMVSTALDLACADDVPLPDPAARLAELALLLDLSDQVRALIAERVTAAERADDAMAVHGTSLRTWLAQSNRMTPRAASTLIMQSRALGRFPEVAQAFHEALISKDQADAICTALDELPADLGAEQVARAQETMIGYSAEFDPAQLRRLAGHVVEVVAPEQAEDNERRKLERDERRAQANRFLRWCRDGFGSIELSARLPEAEGEAVVAVIEAYAAHADRSLDRLDPLAELVSPAQRRADALVDLARHAQGCRAAPTHGGDRPRLVVTIDHAELLQRLHSDPVAAGRLAASSALVSPSALRLLACDCEVLPAVLGGAGQVLDVGRAQRLVTPPIRAALTLRDRGCVMPGCDRAPADCDAHHIEPWQSGGRTSLDNLVLLCRHHHGLLEPRPHAPPDSQWEVRLGDAGLPVIVPPSRVDARRRPRLHQRFRVPPPSRADDPP